MQTLVLPRPQARHHDLSNYFVPLQGEIKFDEHGRPYVQTKAGKEMLSRKKPYHYNITNH